MRIIFCLMVFLFIGKNTMLAQQLSSFVEYGAALHTGDNTPLWQVSNQQGLTSLDNNTYIRGGISYKHQLGKWKFEEALDLVAAAGFSMETYQVNQNGYYGEFGGAYIPEILHRCVEELRINYRKVIDDPNFQQEFHQLLKDYVGRPSPLYLAKRLSELYGCKIYLKREDLNHTGAHKINNAIGQILLAKRMGKSRIIAETGAGQHGVATATVCALMNLECVVYMGKTDVERQHANVQKMEMLGARVVPVTSGNMTLKDATNEAIRDWCCHPADTYYVIGSTVGPHPYPDMVARLQSVISQEIKHRYSHRPKTWDRGLRLVMDDESGT